MVRVYPRLVGLLRLGRGTGQYLGLGRLDTTTHAQMLLRAVAQRGRPTATARADAQSRHSEEPGFWFAKHLHLASERMQKKRTPAFAGVQPWLMYFYQQGRFLKAFSKRSELKPELDFLSLKLAVSIANAFNP
jgi:hypothetical protein